MFGIAYAKIVTDCDAPGVFHHVMIREIERRKIFWNKKDREDFLDRLGKLLPETQTGCYGWAFLSNIKIPLCEERRESMGIYYLL